jgi:uncharacterized damage-inducible protein DinB
METADVLLDLFGRVDEHVAEAVEGLDTSTLLTEPEPGTNPIAWLVWHLTRVQDHHVAELLDAEQVWVSGDWSARFGLDPDPDDNGYGHSHEQVAAVRPDGASALSGYHAEVSARTREFLAGLTAVDLDRVVDERWDPPVTLAVRLISIADDDIQHGGQAVYARGLLERRNS